MNAVRLTVLWNAITAIASEQANRLQRSAFSAIVREAGDLGTAVFDAEGRMIAQAVTGTPGHHNSLARAVGDVVAEFGADRFEPGDALVVNDPYRTVGQLLDISVITPVWRDGAIVGYVGSTAHHTDIGGYGVGAGARDIYQEGLWIPPLRLMKAGERNHDVWDLILANSRTPDLLAGDLHAQIAIGELGSRRLNGLMDANDLGGLTEVADAIVDRSEEAVRGRVRELPADAPTTAEATSVLDLADGSEIEIAARVDFDRDTGDIVVDYSGSSPASRLGINVAWNYTFSYTAFVLRSVLSPDIPNNAGSLAPIRMITEPGSIVDAQPPVPVTARHIVGMLLPMPILRALASIVPDRVMAEGAAAIWSAQANGRDGGGEYFTTAGFGATGGSGARATKPGLTATGYPTGLASAPLEILEQQAPIRFLRKEIRHGSGGDGRQRGGDGQIVEFTVDTGHPWSLNAVVGRLTHPPLGILGGEPGLGGEFAVNGEQVADVGTLDLESGDVVRMGLPGGGGYGPPADGDVEP